MYANDSGTPVRTRGRAYERAFRSGLIVALVVVLAVKWMTGIAFLPAATVALIAFLIAFSMVLRITPR